MIRRLLVLPLFALCLVLGACNDKGKQDIAVVDVSRIVRDSEPGKALNTFLEGIQSDFNQRLVAQQEVYQQNPEDAAARQALETMFVSMQQRLQTEEQNATNILLEQVLQIINTVREARGYSVVVRSDVALSLDKTVDLTDQVIAEVNKATIEFKPVTTDQPGVDSPAANQDEAGAAEGTAESAEAKDAAEGDQAEAASGQKAEDTDAAAESAKE